MKTERLSAQNFGMIYVDTKIKNNFWGKLFLDKYNGASRTFAISDILHIKGSPTHHIYVNADKSVKYISPQTGNKPIPVTKGRNVTDKFMIALLELISK